MSNDRHSRPTAQNDSLPASTVMGGKHLGPEQAALHEAGEGTGSHLGQVSDPPRRGGHLRGYRGLTPR
jgi:hypothetical protein